jgi:transposase
MDDMGVLEGYEGYLHHDCWAARFAFTSCLHCLCNAHILRELEKAVETGQAWAADMRELLLELNILVDCHGGELPKRIQE